MGQRMKYKKPFWAVDQITRETGLIEDVCKCGVGHPNVAFLRANKGFSGVHGCCGCCRQGINQEGIVFKDKQPYLIASGRGGRSIFLPNDHNYDK